MRYLPLVLVIGCATDPDLGDPTESMAVAAVSVCPTGQWCVEPSGTGVLLNAVWAASPDDVFAVGDLGTILRRENDAWTVMVSGTDKRLRGVWGTSSSDVWAVGGAGTILHFDGTAWSRPAAPTTGVDLATVWGASSSDVFFAGQGSILHLRDTEVTTNNFSGSMLGLSGTGPGDVWAAGENAGVRRFDGVKWSSPIPTGLGTSSYYTVLAIATNDAWLTENVSMKESGHWDGARWNAVRTCTACTFNSLSSFAANDIWGAGGKFVGRWNGTSWTTEAPFPTGTLLRGITTTPGNVWVVGAGGLIAHRSL